MLPIPPIGPFIDIFAPDAHTYRTPPAESFWPGMLWVSVFVAVALTVTALTQEPMNFVWAFLALAVPAFIRACIKSRRESRAFEERLLREGTSDEPTPHWWR